mmetsp:Transcript_94003/g.215075  ORF Transcript_94003/g.215075 Transcript_94003/m.215075 type:complete len:214 (-) Transcript_94003:709-1350(-)
MNCSQTVGPAAKACRCDIVDTAEASWVVGSWPAPSASIVSNAFMHVSTKDWDANSEASQSGMLGSPVVSTSCRIQDITTTNLAKSTNSSRPILPLRSESNIPITRLQWSSVTSKDLPWVSSTTNGTNSSTSKAPLASLSIWSNCCKHALANSALPPSSCTQTGRRCSNWPRTNLSCSTSASISDMLSACATWTNSSESLPRRSCQSMTRTNVA